MKGGVLTLGNKSIIEILDKCSSNNVIPKRLGNDDSSGGYIYTLDIPPQAGVYNIYPGLTNPITETKTIIIKFIQMHNMQYNDKLSFMHRGKEITSKHLFKQEITTHNNIFNASMDMYCEPICPNIIDYCHFKNTNNSFFYKQALIKFPVFDNLIRNIIFSNKVDSHYRNDNNANRVAKIGIIFMEMLSGCKPIEDCVPYENSTGSRNRFSNLTKNQKNCCKNYLYQLVRLKKLGYVHGDTHLNNALFIENYDYLDNFRVFLIDFGRTVRSSIGVTNLRNIVTIDNANQIYFSYQMMFDVANAYINEYGNGDNFFNNNRQIIMQSENRFVNKLFSLNLLTGINRLASLTSNIIDPFQKLKTAYIPRILFSNHYFKNSRINTNFNINVNILPNQETKCCYYCIPDECKFITINNEYSNGYRNNVALKAQSIIQKEIKGCFYENKLPSWDGIFLWIIGQGADGTFNLYMSQVVSCFEIGTKHFHIVQHYNLAKYFGAGELEKKGNKIRYNLCSGTYIITPVISRSISQNDVNYVNSKTKQFMEIILNNNTTNTTYEINRILPDNTDVRTQQTLLTENGCCNKLIIDTIPIAVELNASLKKDNLPEMFMFKSLDEHPGCNEEQLRQSRQKETEMQSARQARQLAKQAEEARKAEEARRISETEAARPKKGTRSARFTNKEQSRKMRQQKYNATQKIRRSEFLQERRKPPSDMAISPSDMEIIPESEQLIGGYQKDEEFLMPDGLDYKFSSGIKDDIELGKYVVNVIDSTPRNDTIFKQIESSNDKTFLNNVIILREYVNNICKNAIDILMLFDNKDKASVKSDKQLLNSSTVKLNQSLKQPLKQPLNISESRVVNHVFGGKFKKRRHNKTKKNKK